MASNIISPPTEWLTDQELNPETEVDYFVTNGDLTEAVPISTTKDPKPVAKKVTKSTTKNAS